ncbi:hypothetical protein AB205_0091160, partial [Aquarana catesbeiana]
MCDFYRDCDIMADTLDTFDTVLGQLAKNKNLINYHQKKAPFVGKKDIHFIWVQRRTTAQLSVKVTQCRIARNGLPHIGSDLRRLGTRDVTHTHPAGHGSPPGSVAVPGLHGMLRGWTARSPQ